jgi:CHAT domain-containing protein/Tfp pilus assembly protein PilF
MMQRTAFYGLLVNCLGILIVLCLTQAQAAFAEGYDEIRSAARDLADQEQYQAAAHAFEALVQDEEKHFWPEAIELTPDLMDLASIYDNLARYLPSETLFNRAIAILRSTPDSNKVHLAIALNDLGLLYYRMGRYRDAEAPSNESIDIRKKLFDPNDVRIAFPMDNLGLVYLEEGRHEEAEQKFQEALHITRTARSAKHEAIALDNLGYLYWAQGRLKEAEDLHRVALDLEEKASDAASADIAVTCNSLGSVLVDEGLLVQAEPFLQRALQLWKKVYGLEHPQVAYALANLGMLYHSQRRLIEAEPLLRQGLEIRRKSLGPQHPNTAILIDKLAEVLADQGDTKYAEELANSSLQIKIHALGPEHPETAKTLELLARFVQEQGRLSEALEFARKSSNIRRARASLIAQSRSRGADAEIQIVREGYIRHISILESLISSGAPNRVGLVAEAFEISQLAQASAAANAAFQAGIRSAASRPDVAAFVRERQDAIDAWRVADAQRGKLLALPVAQRTPDAEQTLAEDMQRFDATIQRIDAKLAQEFPRFTELASPKPINFRQVQATLASNEEMISLLIGSKLAFLFEVSPAGVELIRLKLDANQLAQEVDALRQLLDPQANREAKAFDTARAYALYRRTIGYAPHVSEANTILFVPDGAFLRLPLGVLVREDPSSDSNISWLATRYAISVLPAASMVVSMRAQPSRGEQRSPFIGFGDPVLDGEDPFAPLPSLVSLLRGPLADVDAVRKLPPLHDTAKELRDLAQLEHASEDDLFLGERATEKMVKQIDLTRYKVIAFATHGLLAGDLKGLVEPALVLTPPAWATEEDDGVLVSSEIARLKLDADWVILSACNTASGDRPGAEGLSGIAKAFMYAGSRALLVSHWRVVSAAASALTTGMFEALSDPSVHKAEALRRSQSALIKRAEFSHPLYWAPFVFVGDLHRD